MKSLRLIIALCLSLSVPTTVLASLMNAGHCHGGSAGAAPVDAHAMHAEISGEHSRHAMQYANANPHASQTADAAKLSSHTAPSGCDCGCNCSSTHCATSCAALVAIGGAGNVPESNPSNLPTRRGPAHTIAAHGLDILRPPCLI